MLVNFKLSRTAYFMAVCQILNGQLPVRIQVEECGNKSIYKSH
jgi:hypothetical protein